jgi:hypothetical protein
MFDIDTMQDWIIEADIQRLRRQIAESTNPQEREHLRTVLLRKIAFSRERAAAMRPTA